MFHWKRNQDSTEPNKGQTEDGEVNNEELDKTPSPGGALVLAEGQLLEAAQGAPAGTGKDGAAGSRGALALSTQQQGGSGCPELLGCPGWSPGWSSPVEEDAADVVVCDGRLLGAGGHAQRPQEVVDQDVQLLDVLSLSLQHAEHHLVPLAHAVGVGGPDVVLDDGLPLPPAQPAPQEALHLREQGLGVQGSTGGPGWDPPWLCSQVCVCRCPFLVLL